MVLAVSKCLTRSFRSVSLAGQAWTFYWSSRGTRLDSISQATARSVIRKEIHGTILHIKIDSTTQETVRFLALMPKTWVIMGQLKSGTLICLFIRTYLKKETSNNRIIYCPVCFYIKADKTRSSSSQNIKIPSENLIIKKLENPKIQQYSNLTIQQSENLKIKQTWTLKLKN